MLCGENCHKELDAVLPGSSGMSLGSAPQAQLPSSAPRAQWCCCQSWDGQEQEPARLSQPALDGAHVLALGERNVGTSVSCVSPCACAALRAGAKPHTHSLGPAASGDSHSTQCSSLFFTSKILTFAFLKKKGRGKAPQNKSCLISL